MAQGEDLDLATAHAAAMMEQIRMNPKGLPRLPKPCQNRPWNSPLKRQLRQPPIAKTARDNL